MSKVVSQRYHSQVEKIYTLCPLDRDHMEFRVKLDRRRSVLELVKLLLERSATLCNLKKL